MKLENIIKQYNNLGSNVKRATLEKLAKDMSKHQDNKAVKTAYDKLTKLLENSGKNDVYNITVKEPIVLQRANKGIYGTSDIEEIKGLGLPYIAQPIEDKTTGLNKAVSSTDIYDMVTNKIIAIIKKSGKEFKYKKAWSDAYIKDYLIAYNFVTKKPYRSINQFLLSLDGLDNPYFLTFKQIQKLKGKIKKGAKGHAIVYYTMLYTHQKIDGGKKLIGTYDIDKFLKHLNKYSSVTITKEMLKAHSYNQITPILDLKDTSVSVYPLIKYYNVFNGDDIEGIDFDLDNFDLEGKVKDENLKTKNKKFVDNDAAESIIANYPKPAPVLHHGGNRAFYVPSKDEVTLPEKKQFDTSNDYYKTLFHEFSHSTGNAKRLNRDFSGRFGSKKYAFEELIAELSGVFLSHEAGTSGKHIKNSAAYIKSWNGALVKQLEDDNKFILKAAAKSQQSADYILQRDDNGKPLYLRNKKKSKNNKQAEKETKDIDFKTFATFLQSLSDQYKKSKDSKYSVTYRGKVYALPKEFNIGNSKYITYLSLGSGGKKMSFKHQFYLNSLAHPNKPIHLLAEHYPSVNPEKTIIKGFRYIYKDAQESKGLTGVKDPLYKKIVKHLAAKKNIELSNDAAYILGLDLDRTIARVEDSKKYKKDIINELAKHIVNADNKTMYTAHNATQQGLYLVEIGLIINKKKPPKKKGLKGVDVSVFPVQQNETLVIDIKPKKNIIDNWLDKHGTDDVEKEVKTQLEHETKEVLKPTKKDTQTSIVAPFIKTKPITIPKKIKRGKSVRDILNDNNIINESFKIHSKDLARLFGNIERKPKESVAITIASPEGGGKTHFSYQVAQDFALSGYDVFIWSGEEHRDSNLAKEKYRKYFTDDTLDRITVESDTPKGIDTLHEYIEDNDVIIMDSWAKILELDSRANFDRDFRKKYDGKLFLVIFQLTADGKMRGGSKSAFDGDVILSLVKHDNFKENYVLATKNRYSHENIKDVKYNVFYQSILPEDNNDPETIKI